MEIVQHEDRESLEGKKRQYLPYTVEWTCPQCGSDKVTDLTETYLSYPVWGEQYDIPLFCMDCDELEPVKTAEIVPDVTVSIK